MIASDRDRGDDRDQRRQRHHPRHRGLRRGLLLGDQLQHVGQRLEQAAEADAVWAQPRLEAAQQLALGVEDDGDDLEDHGEDHDRLDDLDQRVLGAAHARLTSTVRGTPLVSAVALSAAVPEIRKTLPGGHRGAHRGHRAHGLAVHRHLHLVPARDAQPAGVARAQLGALARREEAQRGRVLGLGARPQRGHRAQAQPVGRPGAAPRARRREARRRAPRRRRRAPATERPCRRAPRR